MIDPVFLVPTRRQVGDLAVGSQALDCFGHFGEIASIYHHGIDNNGLQYVCFYTRLGANGYVGQDSYRNHSNIRRLNAALDACRSVCKAHRLRNYASQYVANMRETIAIERAKLSADLVDAPEITPTEEVTR